MKRAITLSCLTLGALIVLSVFIQNAIAQLPAGLTQRLDSVERASRQAIVFPLSLFVPAGIREGYALRSYIASNAFGEFDSIATPESTFNEIFLTANDYAHGNVRDALLAASYGSFEHENIPVAFFGTVLHVPLTHENHRLFLIRQSHLPSEVYHSGENDLDKLQHFYASGWLKSLLGMNWLVSLAGEFVEFMEGTFVVGSSRDLRDIHANHDGMRFAIEASGCGEKLPSGNLTPNPLPEK